MINPEKVDDPNLLSSFSTSKPGGRSSFRLEIVRRIAAQGLDVKVAESLVDGYAEAVDKKQGAEAVSFEREILRRMKPPAPPLVSAAPAQPAAAPPPPRSIPRPPTLQHGPPAIPNMLADRDRMHDFFASMAEYQEHVAREASQFATLCRATCQMIKPELYENKKG